ncbi:hypothetical protein A0H81_09608 [Grifola frondosa]|uniref:Uncharacterized protein n=1 Tax=Grifola frondosa TaxID=5627 RepID=A0A1C7LZ92_GRIFR|nr:hypothetical protein A0H81_09608 [Grifola frondosa]
MPPGGRLIKQDEQYRKDMYLAFVNNALQQKANGVSDAFDELVDQFNPKKSATSPARNSVCGFLLSRMLSLDWSVFIQHWLLQ